MPPGPSAQPGAGREEAWSSRWARPPKRLARRYPGPGQAEGLIRSSSGRRGDDGGPRLRRRRWPRSIAKEGSRERRRSCARRAAAGWSFFTGTVLPHKKKLARRRRLRPVPGRPRQVRRHRRQAPPSYAVGAIRPRRRSSLAGFAIRTGAARGLESSPRPRLWPPAGSNHGRRSARSAWGSRGSSPSSRRRWCCSACPIRWMPSARMTVAGPAHFREAAGGREGPF